MSLEGRDPEDDPSWASVSCSGHQEGLSEPWTQTRFPGVLASPRGTAGATAGATAEGAEQGASKVCD